jgi:hypothetical protein
VLDSLDNKGGRRCHLLLNKRWNFFLFLTVEEILQALRALITTPTSSSPPNPTLPNPTPADSLAWLQGRVNQLFQLSPVSWEPATCLAAIDQFSCHVGDIPLNRFYLDRLAGLPTTTPGLPDVVKINRQYQEKERSDEERVEKSFDCNQHGENTVEITLDQLPDLSCFRTVDGTMAQERKATCLNFKSCHHNCYVPSTGKKKKQLFNIVA